MANGTPAKGRSSPGFTASAAASALSASRSVQWLSPSVASIRASDASTSSRERDLAVAHHARQLDRGLPQEV